MSRNEAGENVREFEEAQKEFLKEKALKFERHVNMFNRFADLSREDKCRFALRCFPAAIVQLKDEERRQDESLQQAQHASWGDDSELSADIGLSADDKGMLEAVTYEEEVDGLIVLLDEYAKDLISILEEQHKASLAAYSEACQAHQEREQRRDDYDSSQQCAQMSIPRESSEAPDKDVFDRETAFLKWQLKELQEGMAQINSGFNDPNLFNGFGDPGKFNRLERKRSHSPNADVTPRKDGGREDGAAAALIAGTASRISTNLFASAPAPASAPASQPPSSGSLTQSFDSTQ
jgi:hypothetical protein